MKNNPEQDAQFSADFYADVTREQLAAVYAEALSAACDTKAVSMDGLLEEYDSLLDDVFQPYPRLEGILASAMVSGDDKIRILNDTFGNASDLFKSFLKTLTKRGRLDLLRDIHRQCHLINNKRKGRVAVTVTTAAPLDEATSATLTAKLRSIVGGEPIMQTVVDPETIGGIIVRVGDTIFDASIATQLKNVRQQMIDRSIHEIQSRRDSFRNTEGN
ncbi:MAG: ATP synthase F1 subunit delta [Planctomycetia bacterium]|nr:ATP synthase F1 subunit delta [Planctomycetia bacterium]